MSYYLVQIPCYEYSNKWDKYINIIKIPENVDMMDFVEEYDSQGMDSIIL